jgi:hypothetical protein
MGTTQSIRRSHVTHFNNNYPCINRKQNGNWTGATLHLPFITSTPIHKLYINHDRHHSWHSRQRDAADAAALSLCSHQSRFTTLECTNEPTVTTAVLLSPLPIPTGRAVRKLSLIPPFEFYSQNKSLCVHIYCNRNANICELFFVFHKLS